MKNKVPQNHAVPPAADEKAVIYCHRAYRTLPDAGWVNYLIKFLFLTLPFIFFIVLFAGDISLFFSVTARAILMPVFNGSVDVVRMPFAWFGDLSLVDFLGRFPSVTFSFWTGVISCALMVAAMKTKHIPKSVAIYIVFILLITMVSAVYFIVFPRYFPYSVYNFSDLYIKTEIGIWLVIPILMGIALLPLPGSLWQDYTVIASALAYSMLFGYVRYLVFLYILEKFGYIFMATMFIAFDPPLDTIYVIGIYSLYVSYLSTRISGDMGGLQCRS